MLLKYLLEGIDYNYKGNLDIDIGNICLHSKEAKPGSLFVALEGVNFDGHNFIPEAIKAGAIAVLINKDSKFFNKISFPITVIGVNNTRACLPKVAQNFYQNPNQDLYLIGITGTNGKTTISYILEKILKEAGYRTAVIGTLGYRIANRWIFPQNTTPDPLTIQKLMRELVDMGYEFLIMEASSQGLAQGRLSGLKFKGAVFSNLGEEHLDYHKDMEDYFSAKKMLFQQLEEAIAVINVDDPYGMRLWKELKFNKISYGLKEKAEVSAEIISQDILGTHVNIRVAENKFGLRSPLLGIPNLYNILAAVAFSYRYGINLNKIISALNKLETIGGRMERVMGSTKLDVYIDYAHTPQAMEAVLSSLREIKRGSLWVIFGCGGDRYRGKRPLMGKVACQYADHIIVTSDNPRSEDPHFIMEEIKEGLKDCSKDVYFISNRYEAIKKAIDEAQHGDLILIAGKGHESYQLIGESIYPFDDREIATKLLVKRTVREKYLCQDQYL